MGDKNVQKLLAMRNGLKSITMVGGALKSITLVVGAYKQYQHMNRKKTHEQKQHCLNW